MAFGSLATRGRARRWVRQELARVGDTFDGTNPYHRRLERAGTRAKIRRMIRANSAAALPASAVSAYSPRDSRVLGACEFNGSSQYASTSTLSTDAGDIAAGDALPAELGVGGSTFVVFCRLNITSGSTNRAAWGFGDSSTTANYSMLYVTNLEALYLHRDQAASGDATEILAAGQSGRASCAVRYGDDGKVRIAVLAPGATEVTWIDDTSVRSFTADRFSVGALVRSSVANYHDSWVCDVAIGTSAAAITDAAMEQFCKGASPASVGASNHWPMQAASEFTDTIGSVSLTATGWAGAAAVTAAFAEDGKDVAVVRDLTADPTHANYAADVVGGASFSGSNYLTNTSYSPPASGDSYWSFFVRVPDITPSNTAYFVSATAGAVSTEQRSVLLSTAGTLQVLEFNGGATSISIASAFAAADTWHLVVCRWDLSAGASRVAWIAPVGGAFITTSNAITKQASGINRIRVGARASDGTGAVEANTEMVDLRETTAAQVTAAGGEAKWLRARLRNWRAAVSAGDEHVWPLNGDANDTGSGTATNLTWSASAAYSDSLVVSSHQNLMAVGVVTWDSVNQRIDLDGSTGYLRVMNAVDVDTPLVITSRVEPDSVGGTDTVWAASDGTDDEQWVLQRSGTAAQLLQIEAASGRTATFAGGFAVDTVATIQGYSTGDTQRAVSVDGGTEGTDAGSASPTGLDRESWGRKESATPSNYFDGTLTRWLKHTDTADNEAARTWAEEAAA